MSGLVSGIRELNLVEVDAVDEVEAQGLRGRSLFSVFNPSSIAIIGASEVPGKAAERRTRSLLENGFPGSIYLINPKREKIFGRKAYSSILDVDQQCIDLSVIILKPQFILEAVEQSCQKKVKGIILISAGLGSTEEEKNKLQSDILKIAEAHDVSIIGPNCSGFYNSSLNLNLLGIPGIQKGPLSVIAQSGNVIDSLIAYSRRQKLGFSKIISAGNAIDLKSHHYLQALNEDPHTKTVLMYLEEVRRGEEFLEIARQIIVNKPIVVLKVGRTKAGARAAASHTGALAVNDRVVDASFRQAGVVRVSTIDELFQIGAALTTLPYPSGRKVAILSEGGGDNSIAAENLEENSLEIPIFSKELQREIQPSLLDGMAVCNPIDYGGTAEENPAIISKCCEACMKSDEVDAVYITGFFGGFKEFIAESVGEKEEEAAKELLQLVRKYNKPLIVHSSFANAGVRTLDLLREGGVPVFESSMLAAKAISALACYQESKKRAETRPALIQTLRRDIITESMLYHAKQSRRRVLVETEAREILKEYKFPLARTELVTSPEEAVRAAERIGYPIALKVMSPQIVHKSDIGGVKLGLCNSTEVEIAYRQIINNATHIPGANINGVLVSPMATKGVECIIGMFRDPVFGPTVMFGIGGVYVEVIKDVSLRVLPLYQGEAEDMIKEIKGWPLLQGVRGERASDVRSICKVLELVAQVATENPEIQAIDLNPVIVHEIGLSIVDARIVLRE